MEPEIKEYLDDLLFDIIWKNLTSEELDYLISGITSIKNKDKQFMNNILVNDAIQIEYGEYEYDCSDMEKRNKLKEEYKGLKSNTFHEAFIKLYSQYSTEPLSIENVENFKWRQYFYIN